MMHYGSGMHGIFPGYGWLFQLLILTLLILIFWWLLKGSGYGYGKGKETPLEIIERRYAAGEINRKEYQQLKRDIGGK